MNYKIEAISILLNRDCFLERYYPFIPYKEKIIKKLKENGTNSKDEALRSDTLLDEMFHDETLTRLFKRFLNLYKTSKTKLREIDKLDLSESERQAFLELYLLLGVKKTRARLYYLSGLTSLKAIADKTFDEIISLIKQTIASMNLTVKAPLEKSKDAYRSRKNLRVLCL